MDLNQLNTKFVAGTKHLIRIRFLFNNTVYVYLGFLIQNKAY